MEQRSRIPTAGAHKTNRSIFSKYFSSTLLCMAVTSTSTRDIHQGCSRRGERLLPLPGEPGGREGWREGQRQEWADTSRAPASSSHRQSQQNALCPHPKISRGEFFSQGMARKGVWVLALNTSTARAGNYHLSQPFAPPVSLA